MKKAILALTIVACCSNLSQAQIKLGPEAGVTHVNLHQTIDGNLYDSQFKVGARVGAVVDIPIQNHFYIQPGIAFQYNSGTRSSFQDQFKTGTGLPSRILDERNYRINTLNIPVYFLYKTGANFDDNHFFIGLGPYLNVTLGGYLQQNYMTTLNGQDRPTYYDKPLLIGNEKLSDDYRFFDLGFNATIGYEFAAGFFIRGYYGVGVLNMAPGGSESNHYRNFGGGLTVGFLFKTSEQQAWGWK